jgi:hypothetical protein
MRRAPNPQLKVSDGWLHTVSSIKYKPRPIIGVGLIVNIGGLF